MNIWAYATTACQYFNITVKMIVIEREQLLIRVSQATKTDPSTLNDVQNFSWCTLLQQVVSIFAFVMRLKILETLSFSFVLFWVHWACNMWNNLYKIEMDPIVLYKARGKNWIKLSVTHAQNTRKEKWNQYVANYYYVNIQNTYIPYIAYIASLA